MKVIVLCAGYATRLYPLTLDKPKPLLAVKGKPILEYIIDSLKTVDQKTAHISTVYVVTNDKFHTHFERWAKAYSGPGLPFSIQVLNDKTTSNDDRLGALGDINFAVEQAGINEETMVIGGDNLFDMDLNNLVKLHKEKNATVLAAYDMQDPEKCARRYGVLVMDQSYRIVEFEEKPEKPAAATASTAIYLFTKADLSTLRYYLHRGEKTDNLGDFIAYLISQQEVYGFPFDQGWIDIGSKEELMRAEEEWS
jgi:glucose-1-phosphate thymidylyltransferase